MKGIGIYRRANLKIGSRDTQSGEVRGGNGRERKREV